MSEPLPARRPQQAPMHASGGAPARRSCGGTLLAMLGAATAAVYLLNLGWGGLELIPDNIPGVGNLDEVGATALLLGCLRYLVRGARRGGP